MRRGIAQIAVCSGENGGDALYVLCNDETLWCLSGGSWYRLPDIPQDDEEEKEPTP